MNELFNEWKKLFFPKYCTTFTSGWGGNPIAFLAIKFRERFTKQQKL